MSGLLNLVTDRWTSVRSSDSSLLVSRRVWVLQGERGLSYITYRSINITVWDGHLSRTGLAGIRLDHLEKMKEAQVVPYGWTSGLDVHVCVLV